MRLSYAGVSLALPTKEIDAWVSANIDLNNKTLFTGKPFPGKSLTGLTTPSGFTPIPPIKLNTLYWRQGATQFAYSHFLCDRDQLLAIQTQAMGTACSAMNLFPLVMDDGNGGTITTNMYLAYQTPLSGVRGVNGTYMITLVDPRYYWWFISAPDFGAIGPATTWDSLYASCQSKLGQAITRDSVDPVYLAPAPAFNLKYESFPMVLDAIAFNCGQRITYDLAGKIWAMNYPTSKGYLNSNLGRGLSKRAGDIHYGGTL